MAITNGTMHNPDIVSQTLFCETAHARVDPLSPNTQLSVSGGYNPDVTLRSGCSPTLLPDIVSQTPLCETIHAQMATTNGTLQIPDIVSQTPLCETAHAQVDPLSPKTQLSVSGGTMRAPDMASQTPLCGQINAQSWKRKRPNTDLLFPPGDKPPAPSVNILRAVGIAELLSSSLHGYNPDVTLRSGC
jgi:hypothetical protein